MFNESKKNISIIAIFILLIGLPVITLRWVGGDYSAAEKRILAPMPTLLQDDGSLNINARSEIKDWFGDHIGFRDEFVFVNSYIRYNFFHQSPSAQVHIGKDGWFYYTLDNNLEIAIGAYPLSDETLAAILQNHLAVQKKLQAKGIDYVIVLPTSKVSIYPEYMRTIVKSFGCIKYVASNMIQRLAFTHNIGFRYKYYIAFWQFVKILAFL